MKRYILKAWVRDLLLVFASIGVGFLICLLFKINDRDRQAIKTCMDQGVSQYQCEKGYYGW